MKTRYAIGLDFGTNSCRSLIVDISNGRELAGSIFPYPSGIEGVIVDPRDPNVARQNPADYLEGIRSTIKESIEFAQSAEKDFSVEGIIGIGVDTTGSSPMPVAQDGQPLCFLESFRGNPDAMVWLWKDHTGYGEAEEITRAAAKMRPEYLAKIGGAYSSEWFWSKILHCERVAPDVFHATHGFMEICDFIPAHLCGDTRLKNLKASVCAAGHKALFNRDWGGLPDEEFLRSMSPGLGMMRGRLYADAYPSDQRIGTLSAEWSRDLGLSRDVAVAVGAFDAHMGAVGAGIRPGALVKILGTSTCDIMISPVENELADIPGVCGIVEGSVIDGHYGIEAGQSAVGDIFSWLVNHLVPDRYGKSASEKFLTLGEEASRLFPGESGLMALDWNNGNRTILTDARLTGLLMGQTLHTQPHEIYRALIESTAFGALTIIDRIEEYGVKIEEVVTCGGLAYKNPLLLQIYADACNRSMKVSGSRQTPALGAAIFGSVAAGIEKGGHGSVMEAQKTMTHIAEIYTPDPGHVEVYRKLYRFYQQLHDGFGIRDRHDSMYGIMKGLLAIRDQVRRERT